MHYIYLCGAISENLNNLLGYSIAGNKFSINMARALDEQCAGKLSFISTSWVQKKLVKEHSSEIWPGKPMLHATRGKRFFLEQLILRRNIMRLLKRVRKETPHEKIVVFVENAPFAAATACAALQKKLDLSCYSITIDTPFTAELSTVGIRGRINKWMFDQGFKAMRSFNGLISFSEDVKKDLQMELPFCQFAIGCSATSIPDKLPEITSEKVAVYAGTLIYYNGIQELLQAFALLGPAYQLHIYGYGPLEEAVRKAAQAHANIVFHGRFDSTATSKILTSYPLLINPRRIDPAIENFTFPSKLIDYILTGRSVLTSKFKTLPAEYYQFVYTMEDTSPEAIAQGVREALNDPPELRQEKARAGIAYIRDNQTYDRIAQKIMCFIAKNEE